MKKQIVLCGLSVALICMLKYFKDDVVCIVDNFSNHKEEHNIPILKSEEAVKLYPNALYVMTALRFNTCRKIENILKNFNPDIKVSDWSDHYVGYIEKFTERNINKDILQNLLDYNKAHTPVALCVIPLMHCNLTCVKCRLYCPDSENKSIATAKKITGQVKLIADSLNGLLSLPINGGEIFIYKDLPELLYGLGSLSNVCIITVPTNGAIIPNDEMCIALNKTGAIARISDYGKYSPKITELIEKLEHFDVNYLKYERAEKWFDFGDFTPHNRDSEVNFKASEKCIFGNFGDLLLFDDYLHICGRLLAMRNKNAGNWEERVLYLPSATKENIKNYVAVDNLAKICDYCEYPPKIIPAAEQ